MQVQTIVRRISECIDDLGLLLDQIYKFPQKQREVYFDKIQTLKNKLLALKSNLRQTNSSATEKQYKQIYLSMNTLKNQINTQNALLPISKQNKEVHRTKDIKEAKRNYEEALRLISEKDQQIAEMNILLNEKEQLIKINYEELRRVKHQFELTAEDNRIMKFQFTTLSIDLQSARASANRIGDELHQYKIREQQKDKAFQKAIQEMERLKMELIIANQKLNHFEQLAQVSIKKTRLVQENIKKVQREAFDLNQNYRAKQHDNFRKLKQISQMQYVLNSKDEAIKQTELQNKRLREDIQVLQNQLIKANKINVDQKVIANEQKDRLSLEYRRLNSEIDVILKRENQLKRMFQQSQKKYLVVISKLNAAEEFKAKNKQLQLKHEILEGKIENIESLLDERQRQVRSFLKQKERISEQLERSLLISRQAEVEIFKFREKIKIKDQERYRLMQEIQNYQNRLKQLQKKIVSKEVAYQSLQTQMKQERNRLQKIQQKTRIKDKQIESIKIKLMRAKIQTIHQIRQVIN